MHHILTILNQKGFRSSKIRTAIVNFLIKNPEPLSSIDLQKLLAKKKMAPNKTTVYRELDLLKKQNIIRELQFWDGIRRYEITPDDHHHHIVCLNCETVGHVELTKDLETEEKMIAQNNNFKVLNHSLEFYGMCKNCQ